MKEASEASSFSVQIAANHLSSELAESMKEHSQSLTKMYHKLHKLVEQKVDDMAIYNEKVLDEAKTQQEAFKIKVEAARAMIRHLKKGAKKIPAKAAEPKT